MLGAFFAGVVDAGGMFRRYHSTARQRRAYRAGEWMGTALGAIGDCAVFWRR